MNYSVFFEELGFVFNKNLKSSAISIETNDALLKKLDKAVYYYKNPKSTNTSFYLIITPLLEEEINEVRKYVWNKNDADIIFYYPNNEAHLKMLYAKYAPTVTLKDSLLGTFSFSENDKEKLDQISQWKFDSGAFWFNYHQFINKAKYKGIDKELVATLKSLKTQLDENLQTIIPNRDKCEEVVQALIDRTLYIKYLEDNLIINSYFYTHYFNDANLNYRKLLEQHATKEINRLFVIIHEIFNNSLFDSPKIEERYLTAEVCTLISNSFKSDLDTGQLRLFDFRFDVLPIEFISYIYEIFLSEKQLDNGIFYTPKKLAQLIVDDVIQEDKIGSIIDPSCGSGMFLIVGFQRLLEIAQKQNKEPKGNIEKIRFRTQLLYENIFGVEKELTAQRFTLFSLSLQIFNGINPTEIKEYIAKQLRENKKIDLFSEYPFSENIIHQNTLSLTKKPLEGKVFSYIVGNPPFFEIKNTPDTKEEINFLNNYKVSVSEDEQKLAKDIVGRHQISQCFFLKIKEWSNGNTRFGFVSNSSNFYNDHSETFQTYFYSHYGIEKIYELSRVKKILFEKAKESVVAIVFSNNLDNKHIDYYPVELGLFSKKPFELLIIQEDKAIEIKQDELVERGVRLRDFLVGNSYDNLLIEKLNNNDLLENYILDKDGLFASRGIELVGHEEIKATFDIDKNKWEVMSKSEKSHYYSSFKNIYLSSKQSDEFNIPFIKPSNIEHFKVNSYSAYLGNDISMFHRPRKKELYSGKRIIWSRIGKSIKAVYLEDFIYFDFDLYVLKLQNENYYNLIVAILNSNLISYFSNIYLKKRVESSFPKIGIKDILNIPIPKELDQNLVAKISTISQKLTEGKYEYSEKEEELNELIYDLYELSYWEKQRIRDYFLPKTKIGRKKNALESYKNTLKELLGFYFTNPISIEETTTDFCLIVLKVSFSNNSDNPKANKTKQFLLNEIFEQNPNANFLASQEKIFGKDCVYIIKDDTNKNWTETKAFEDGQDILKHLIPNENGERIH